MVRESTGKHSMTYALAYPIYCSATASLSEPQKQEALQWAKKQIADKFIFTCLRHVDFFRSERNGNRVFLRALFYGKRKPAHARTK